MGVKVGPRIPTDNIGLALHPNSPRSYPGSGNTWYDLSGNGRDGTVNSGTFTSDKIKIRFDAQDESVTFDSYIVSNDKSLSFWIKSDRPLSVTDNWQIGFLDPNYTYGSMFGMMYGVGQCEDLGFWGYGAPYDLSVESTTNKYSSDGNWHCITITYDNQRNVRIWVDGTQQQWLYHNDYTTKSYTAPMTTTNNTFVINSRGTWNSGMTYVDLGSVYVYEKTLNESEIMELYNSQKNMYS